MADGLTVEQLREIADKRLESVADGAPLTALDRALIELATASSMSSLDPAAIDLAIANALSLGATSDQLQEILSLVAGLGVHSLMVAESRVTAALRHACVKFDEEMDGEKSRLWARYVQTNGTYWAKFENFSPGFLKSMLHLSPMQFEAFFTFCAVPWRGKTVSAEIKELAAMACDSSPSHRFLAGFLFHLEMAIEMGIGQTAIREALDIAAAAPPHRGTR